MRLVLRVSSAHFCVASLLNFDCSTKNVIVDRNLYDDIPIGDPKMALCVLHLFAKFPRMPKQNDFAKAKTMVVM